MLKRKQGKLIPLWTLISFSLDASVKLLVHLGVFFPHLKIYMSSSWIFQLTKLKFGGNILKEKTRKCSASSVSKSQLEILREKLMVLNEFNVMVSSRKHYAAECYQTYTLIPELPQMYGM